MRKSLPTAIIAAALLWAGVGMPEPAAAASKPTAGALYTEGPTGRYRLGGRWLFRHDPADEGLGQRWQRRQSTSGWGRVMIPHSWNATDLSHESQLGSVGWYRRDFRLPSSSSHLRWILRFESVNYRATVWLNGRPIGKSAVAALPFELVAQRAKRTGVNRLVVRVDSRRSTSDLPPGKMTRFDTPGGGWWNDGGILREVYLRSVRSADMTRVVVRPVLPCRRCAARVEFTAVVKNVTPTARRLSVTARFGARKVKLGRSRVKGFGFTTFKGKLRLPKPRLWSPSRPYLYPVRIELREGESGSLRQAYRVRSGVRSVRISRDGRLYLNGRRTVLRGASMHEDHPGVGAALSSRDRKSNIALLRRIRATVTRSHYPLHPQTLEMADRKGILVWSQAPVYQADATTFGSPEFRARAVKTVERMISRDINRPSVIAWSIGNELPSRPGEGLQLYIRKAISAAKKLDRDRLVALDIAGYPSIEKQQVYRKLDAIGINDYFGWYPGPGGQILSRDDLVPYLSQMHRYYPSQGLFVTEVGAEANRNGPIDEKGTYEFQTDYMRFQIQAIESQSYMNGTIIWILRDFRVRPEWDGGNPKPTPPFNMKGLFTHDGKAKPAVEEVTRLFKR